MPESDKLGKSIGLSLLIYAAIAFYKADMWIVLHNDGSRGLPLCELTSLWQCLWVDCICTCTFKLFAFAYLIYKLLNCKLKWYENLTVFLAALGLAADKIYGYEDTLFSGKTDSISALVLIVTTLGLYELIYYLLLFFKVALNWLNNLPDAFSGWLGHWHLQLEQNPLVCSWLIIFACWLPWAIVKYPLGIDEDAYYQIEEYFGYSPLASRYFPVTSSLFMGAMVDLGRVIFGSIDRGGFFLVLVQMAICSACLAYTIAAGFKLQFPKRWNYLMLVVYSVAPIYSSYCTSILKDNLYACSVVLFTAISAVILLSEPKNLIYPTILIASAFSMCALRNNGIFIVLFCLVFVLAHILFFKTVKAGAYKQLGFALAATAIMFGGYTHLLTHMIHYPPGGLKEALSLPFQQTARYITYHGSEITPEEIEAIDAVIDYSLPYGYNSLHSNNVKKTYRGRNQKLPAYFAVWAKQFIKHPFTCIEATIACQFGFFSIDAECIYIHNVCRDINRMIYHAPQFLIKPKAIAMNLTECLWRAPLLNLADSIGLAFYVIIGLTLRCLDRKDSHLFLILLPAIVGILVCVASPSFFLVGGPRYALPVVYAAPFCLGLILIGKEEVTQRA
ncbi:MAG: DUF6020 family protein [bacterium]|nr:DUF6020 family protein [bacterium]